MAKDRTIGIIGGSGWLGRALATSMLEARFIAPASLTLSNRSGAPKDLEKWPGVRWTTDNRELVRRSDVVVVSVRPEQFPALAIDAHGKLVLSVMAGIRAATLEVRTRSERVVRAMPNAAAEIGKSYTPWFALEAVSAADKAWLQRLFATFGTADEVQSETEMDYLTGLTGSGPAFPALLADAMLTHALANGLRPDIARRAVQGLMAGAGALIGCEGSIPGDVVRSFLDYRGTTAAGLHAMTGSGFAQAVHAGLDAAEAAAIGMADTTLERF